MNECIFCKIVKGELPSSKVYENEKVLAFLDINPTSKGHTLVIPKEHYKDIFDIPEDLLKEVIAMVKKIAPAVQKGAKADGLTIGQSNGKAAHQVIPHIHFHIMPRKDGDGMDPWPAGKYKEGEMKKYLEKIVNFL
ncbi:MAG: HIT family protein [archaeon]